ncbi:hypothetical protein ACHWQZ_G009744 [Mnemiopsis leidyi]
MVVEGPNKIHKLVRLFHDLIERGDVIECEKLHKKHNLDVNIPLGKEKFTALHKACYYGHLECVHWLVWHTADVNVKSVQGWTPAHIAAIRGKDQCVEGLLCHKADMTVQDEGGQCPIHLAAAHGNTFTLQTICRKGGDLHLRDINGWRAIHHAAYNGKLGCVQTIAKWGGDLDTVTLVTGDTPLHLAAARGHLPVVKYIISNVEDWVEMLAAINNDAETPLEKAIFSEEHAVVDYLSNLQVNELNEVDEGFPLHVAAAQGDISALKRMIGSGLYSVSARDDHQSTPAHKAAGHGQVEALRWLIDNEADVELVNASGENVKDVAKRFGKTQCVELLGGYTEDEEEETSPEARALNKVDVLEEELKEAKIAVNQLGGSIPADTVPERNAVLSEAQELREMLEHERIKREKMEATIVELRNQLSELSNKEDTPLHTPAENLSDDSSTYSTTSSSVSRKRNSRNSKKRRNVKPPLTRGVFISTNKSSSATSVE